jgi:hypothetical protein
MLKRRTQAFLFFERDERHSNSALFILMIVTLLLAAGAALDYARVANMREGIETAVKSASEAGTNALQDVTLGDGAIKTAALSHFDKGAAVARHVGTIGTPFILIDRTTATVRVDAKGTVAMTVGRLIGIDEVEVPATSTATWAPKGADAL